jgi:hypothetical protein
MTEYDDPEVARLLQLERARPDPDESTSARVLARVEATFAGPAAAAANPGPSSKAPPVRSLGVVARTAMLVLPLVAGGALLAMHTLTRPPVPAPASSEVVTADTGATVPPEEEPALSASSTPVAEEPARRRSPSSASLPPSEAIDLRAERTLLDRARAALLHGDALAALASVGEHARRFPHGALAEEREALRVEALVSAERYDEARTTAARFHAARPGSLLTPAVDTALRSIP